MGVPGSANPLLLASTAADTAYQVSRSLRFNSSDSAYLSRTPSSAGNRKTWTWSGWVKRSAPALNTIFGVDNGGGTSAGLIFSLSTASSEKIEFFQGGTTYRITTQVFRDFSAWYHIVLALDTTAATANNRIRLYVNGSEVTAFDTLTNPTQNADLPFNNTVTHSIGSDHTNTGPRWHFSGYLAEIHFIDGQALTPSSFTEVSATTGQLVPKQYSGSYGTNGFKLDFSNNASTTTVSQDSSGNNNHWTANNISVAAGAGNDSLVDTPTSYGTDDFLGGSVRGNYCTLNPLQSGSGSTLTNGNLDIQATQNGGQTLGTIGVSSGKWYFEGTVTAYAGNEPDPMIGISSNSNPLTTNYPGQSSSSYAIYCLKTSSLIQKVNNGTFTNTGTTQVALNDVIGIAFDLDSGKFWASKNGVWIDSGNPAAGTNALFSGITGSFLPSVRGAGSTSTAGWSLNFGQRPFAYTAPSGFKALVDTNIPVVIAKPNTAFDVVTYTGTGATLTPTSSLGFSPDLVWIKSRSAATDNTIYDAVRGAQARLESNNTDAEVTSDGGLTAFNSNGFTLGTLAQVNTNAATYVAWCWDEAVADGFDIVTYTGNGANRTIAHSLGIAPSFMIVKQRTAASTTNWAVWHSSLANTEYLLLNSTAAKATGATYWNSTSPTGSVFSLGTSTDVNANNGTYVAYLWSPVAGYSSAFTYTGNGSSSGPFVYLGFRPRFFFVKRTDSTGDWWMYDAARNPYNVTNYASRANSSAAEVSDVGLDMLSNGFRYVNDTGAPNLNGATYVGFAWAESPFQYARAR